jgi:hypothetical protein
LNRHGLGALLTTTYLQRWPFAPRGLTVRVVPSSRFAEPWAGKYSYDTRTIYLNADDAFAEHRDGLLLHELAHARWSAPLPDLVGEEGSTALILSALDEVRIHHWLVRAHPPARAPLRTWLAVSTPDWFDAHNTRGIVLTHIYAYGQVHAGVYTADEASEFHEQIAAALGDHLSVLDDQIVQALGIAPGAYAELAALSRVIDSTALHRLSPQ